MRNDFERLAAQQGLDLTRSQVNHLEYEHAMTSLAWKFWQAGRNNYKVEAHGLLYGTSVPFKEKLTCQSK